jgi:hypothetical protein
MDDLVMYGKWSLDAYVYDFSLRMSACIMMQWLHFAFGYESELYSGAEHLIMILRDVLILFLSHALISAVIGC